MYHLSVVQNERFIRIEIRRDASNAELYIGATIYKDSLSGHIGRPYVVIDEKLSGRHSTEGAFGLADWIRMAAVAAGQLDYSITGKDDFDRKWTARMVGRTVVLESKSAPYSELSDQALKEYLESYKQMFRTGLRTDRAELSPDDLDTIRAEIEKMQDELISRKER